MSRVLSPGWLSTSRDLISNTFLGRFDSLAFKKKGQAFIGFMQFSFDPNLRDIADKVEDGERLSFADGLSLFATVDLTALGKLADFVRRKKHGLTTYYNVNRHFNHTNICVADCKFCGFYRRSRQYDAYTHSI